MKKKIVFIIMLVMTLTGSYIGTTNAASSSGETMPEFSSVPPPRKSASTDQNIEIEAKAVGTPTPEIRWYKHGRRIVESDKYSIYYKDGRSTLTIKNAKISDSGVYEVVAENDLGKVSATCEILVL
ncbi:immunoglobulin domain-containing protein [Sanguibacteroides justesenii]|uniref:Ig-like domain-containing protein n=1 Tax=Sanguibacteroides justesenii TaxID=1547597 RepID=A0A0C3RJY0_9PORP|nr:immunoglobulin domain-containing protein [Sanguibacteroides justesenii]KIO46634.1 hypothetical protein BA92_01840 [Sanguibacteroides justesenii]